MTTIYHNPRCSTSRNTLEHLRQKGLEPEVIEYLQTPLSREALVKLVGDAGLTAREAIRSKEAMYAELGLDAPGTTEDQLFDAMAAHPILMNRPFVVTEKGTRLCRPVEAVDEIL